MRLISFRSGDLKSHTMIKFAPAQEEVRTIKIKAIKRYSDIRLHKVIEPGTVLDVDEARADHLVKEGMAEIVKEPAKTAQRKE